MSTEQMETRCANCDHHFGEHGIRRPHVCHHRIAPVISLGVVGGTACNCRAWVEPTGINGRPGHADVPSGRAKLIGNDDLMDDRVLESVANMSRERVREMNLEALRAMVLRMHRYAMYEGEAPYMSVPADPKRDADLLLMALCEEYVALRDNASPTLKTAGEVLAGWTRRSADAEREREMLRLELAQSKEAQSALEERILELEAATRVANNETEAARLSAGDHLVEAPSKPDAALLLCRDLLDKAIYLHQTEADYEEQRTELAALSARYKELTAEPFAAFEKAVWGHVIGSMRAHASLHGVSTETLDKIVASIKRTTENA